MRWMRIILVAIACTLLLAILPAAIASMTSDRLVVEQLAQVSPTPAAADQVADMIHLPLIIGPPPTRTPLPTRTALPTRTPLPTLTALPTRTPGPMLSPTPTPNHQPPSPFGIQSTLSLASGTGLGHAVDLQSSWVHLGDRISWRALQPNVGDPIHWELLATFEAELRGLKQAGITPVVIINDAPRWATILPTSCSAIRSNMFPAYAQFVRALVARYHTAEYNVHNWELGNEPDVAPTAVGTDNPFGCWGDVKDPFYGGRHYGEMLKVVGPAIKAEDAQARIWTGGLLLDRPDNSDPKVGRPELFLQGILEAGAAPYFDVVAYHVYDYFSEPIVDFDTVEPYFWKPWGGRVVGKARFLRTLMAQYAVDKPLVANEVGLLWWCKPGATCSPNATFYDAQANFIVRTLARGSGNAVQGFAWYALEWPGYLSTSLLFQDGSRKPVYNAYQQLAVQLAGTTFRRTIDYGAGIEAYVFGRANEEVQLIWTTSVTTSTISLPQSQLLRVLDRDGQLLVPAVEGTNSQLTVGFAPIYVVTRP